MAMNQTRVVGIEVCFGKPQLIPVDEISITEMPEGMLNHLIRTNGMSLGPIKYGHFKNTKTGQKINTVFRFLLYLRDSARFLGHEETTPAYSHFPCGP